MGKSIVDKVKTGLLFMLLFPLSLYPFWEEEASFGSTILDKPSFSKGSPSFCEEGKAGEAMEEDGWLSDEGEIAYAPPPGINEGDTPQKILPLDGEREGIVLLFLAAGFILVKRNRRQLIF